jgi:hypothetical protein
MHGESNIKFISAQQARIVYKHQNIKRKLLKTNASVWFNKICTAEHLQPKYTNIRYNLLVKLNSVKKCTVKAIQNGYWTLCRLKIRKLLHLETPEYEHPLTQHRIPDERNPKQNMIVRVRPDLLTEALPHWFARLSQKFRITLFSIQMRSLSCTLTTD